MVEVERDASAERTIAVFDLHGEVYGVDTSIVSEIARIQDIAPVPDTPEFVDGVMNLRGRIIPVVDLRTRFGMPRAPHTNATRVVITELADNLVGMVVDAVTEIRTIHEDEIDDSGLAAAEIDGDYVSGLLKLSDRLIIMLDLVKAFEDRLATAV